ncbi:MAG: DedA family protein [Gammaproteobacteria bacterium]|nr:DedA family protein [Gammaproteobacteria bacterium]
MLAPMAVAKPKRANYFAALTTVTSVVGGIFGYAIGFFLIAWIMPKLIAWGYADAFEHASAVFNKWGFWAIFLAGITPIPYKIFTIAAGAASLSLPVFIIASAIGRGARFFAVAWLSVYAGQPVINWAARYPRQLAVACVLLVLALAIWWLYF